VCQNSEGACDHVSPRNPQETPPPPPTLPTSPVEEIN
jgi:hypothetical protein